MIRTIFLSVAFTSLALVTLNAEPQASSKKTKKETTAESSKAARSRSESSATPSVGGWSLVKGTWTHTDGYKYVNGQVVKVGSQARKPTPKPPTTAELNT